MSGVKHFFRKSAILAFSLLQRLTIVKSLLIGMENHVFQNFQSIYSASFDQKENILGKCIKKSMNLDCQHFISIPQNY